ncbi:sigma-54-dependent transcriptional regulator [Qiania dongpingensis]|uniref:Sigma-54-dependent Fis family transcriptional regulator n=1 Tax=Qiania dongpingensis TaxID=2763669 RepID=A0A7G9G6Q8_9FIRM|nr:sigma-54-dependent transcriptional regulator [Qiania dongpingensis]QNM06490.1 sigma-54-dependent Fis family transcriptional regulator [Qiania dongpingensis]
MKKASVLAIAPYDSLKETLQAVSLSFSKSADIDVFVGDLEQGLHYLHQFPASKYDVIISRGGTAKLLQKTASVPIVEVETSAYDMLRTITAAKQYQMPFAVVGFSSITTSASLLRNILKLDFEILEITSEEDVQQKLSDLKASGVSLVLGDSITVKTASRLGLLNILITSGRESVEKAYQKAIDYYQNIVLTQVDSSIFRSVIDSGNICVMLFDQTGGLFYDNIFSQDSSFLSLEDTLRSSIPRLDEEQELRMIKRQKKVLFQIYGKRIPLRSQVYYAFYMTRIVAKSYSAPALLFDSFDTYKDDLMLLSTGCDSMSLLMKKIGQLGPRQFPVFIHGEYGSGTETIAQYIHKTGESKSSSMISINCQLITPSTWNSLVENSASPLNGNGYTIFFQDVHLLSSAMQEILNEYLKDTALSSRCLILSSSALTMEDLIAGREYNTSLYKQLAGLILHVPSLAERREDIPVLSTLCLNYYNSLLGREIIGFEQDALEYLKNCSWKLNLFQLHNVVKQLAISSTSFYITLKEVKYALNERSSDTVQLQNLDLSKTLDEIEKDVINLVLMEENMHQTKAAERLGISRSTLWRKLNH